MKALATDTCCLACGCLYPEPFYESYDFYYFIHRLIYRQTETTLMRDDMATHKELMVEYIGSIGFQVSFFPFFSSSFIPTPLSR